MKPNQKTHKRDQLPVAVEDHKILNNFNEFQRSFATQVDIINTKVSILKIQNSRISLL